MIERGRVSASNRRLLLELRQLSQRETPEPVPEPGYSAPEPREARRPVGDPSSPEIRFQRLVAQLRSGDPAWRGGLSREEREALRVLLRAERALDPANPLR